MSWVVDQIANLISRVLIESKITLGLGGVVIVILSVVASVGCFGYMDIESTLIIFQILPFLILAIGVDNMFILVQTYQGPDYIELNNLGAGFRAKTWANFQYIFGYTCSSITGISKISSYRVGESWLFLLRRLRVSPLRLGTFRREFQIYRGNF